jgi:hypothetical protein
MASLVWRLFHRGLDLRNAGLQRILQRAIEKNHNDTDDNRNNDNVFRAGLAFGIKFLERHGSLLFSFERLTAYQILVVGNRFDGGFVHLEHDARVIFGSRKCLKKEKPEPGHKNQHEQKLDARLSAGRQATPHLTTSP